MTHPTPTPHLPRDELAGEAANIANFATSILTLLTTDRSEEDLAVFLADILGGITTSVTGIRKLLGGGGEPTDTRRPILRRNEAG